jgi:hypothetical protein
MDQEWDTAFKQSSQSTGEPRGSFLMHVHGQFSMAVAAAKAPAGIVRKDDFD